MAGSPKFQAFTVTSNGTQDRIITDITVFPAFDFKTTTSFPTGHKAKALWDTGATRSLISPGVATTLALTPVGQGQVMEGGGLRLCSRYMVNFRLPNQVGMAGVLVSELSNHSHGFDVIVGMDVITVGDFSITNVNGMTVCSFRTPSCVPIDYVKEWRAERFSGVGRNDPCPCGATKPTGQPIKFKHCHGAGQ